MSTIECHYCSLFQEAKWRINPDADDEESKRKKIKLRHCGVIQKYIPSHQETCDNFRPSNKFWCDKLGYWISVKACITKKAKGNVDECHNCSQYQVIMRVARALSFLERKLAAEAAAEEAEVNRPLLLKRRSKDGESQE